MINLNPYEEAMREMFGIAKALKNVSVNKEPLEKLACAVFNDYQHKQIIIVKGECARCEYKAIASINVLLIEENGVDFRCPVCGVRRKLTNLREVGDGRL